MKNITVTRYYCIFPVPGKKEKTKTNRNRSKTNSTHENKCIHKFKITGSQDHNRINTSNLEG